MKKMIVLVILAIMPVFVSAQPEIKSANFTITKVHQYNIQVVRIAGRNLIVDVEDFGRRRFQVPRDFTFEIDGKPQTLNQLVPGQRLRAYVTETESGELMLVQNSESTEGVMGEQIDLEVDEVVAEMEEDSHADPVVNGQDGFESPPVALPETAQKLDWLVILAFVLLLGSVLTGTLRRKYEKNLS